MSTGKRVHVSPHTDSLKDAVAARFLATVHDLLGRQPTVHVVLTGGSIGIGLLATVAADPAVGGVDWTRVHFWWGDERFVPKEDSERNELQARAALLDALPTPASNIHPFPASDEIVDLDDAAEDYAAELARFGTETQPYPRFDLTFLGVGPDGHIASLFPGHATRRDTIDTVEAVRNSPKPPPNRLTLTLPVINSSDRIWLVLGGSDKAAALGLALAGATVDEVPVSGVHGRSSTDFYIDQAAAADVPTELIAQAD